MKTSGMKTAVAIFLIFVFSADLAFASSLGFPGDLTETKAGEVKNYLAKVSNIPVTVMDAVKKATPGENLKMADKGGEWNSTDFVMDSSLPFRRLIWSVK